MNNSESRTLRKNMIKRFLLRIDLISKQDLKIAKIAESVGEFFDRTEKRQVSEFRVHFTEGDSSVSSHNRANYVHISEKEACTVTFSEVENGFWLESDHYLNNAIYKGIMDNIIIRISDLSKDMDARRIGLRYINEFKCNNINHIGNYYGKRLSDITKKMMTQEQQSRVIGMEEYNYDENKLRQQYGIPNSFYPAVITSQDLILDIDSFSDRVIPIADWSGVIETLNHRAYDHFIREINPKFLEALR